MCGFFLLFTFPFSTQSLKERFGYVGNTRNGAAKGNSRAIAGRRDSGSWELFWEEFLEPNRSVFLLSM